MRTVRFLLLLVSCGSLAAWWILRPPYSPSQDLPLVAISAYEIDVPGVEAGNALARAACHWKGVTAAAYNPNSGLLAVSHTRSVAVEDLQRQLQILVPHPVTLKVFPEPSGPKCPVPAHAIAALPMVFLITGIVSGLAALLLLLQKFILPQSRTNLPLETHFTS